VKLLILKAVALLFALACFTQTAVFALQRQPKAPAPVPETSSDSSFNPEELAKLAVVVVGEQRFRDTQTDKDRLVEDEFVQVLLGKGYSLASRSDVQAVVKEQRFQKSGLTEDNAAALGKMLNVPAVMVVRVTEFSSESKTNPKTKTQYTVARASMAARLIGVETGAVLWMGKLSESGNVSNRNDAPRALAHVAKSIATAFPERKPADKSTDSGKDRKSLKKAADHSKDRKTAKPSADSGN